MKKTLNLLAFLVLHFFLAALNTRAKEPATDAAPTVETVFASISRSTATLRNKLKTSDKENVELVDKIDSSVAYLRVEVTTDRMGIVPETYLKSIALDADLLKDVANRKEPISMPERASLTEGLQVVSDDLAVKVAHIRQPMRSPALVEVTVRARTSGKEVDDCEVWFVPKGWFSNKDFHKRFDRPTNQSMPPKMSLPPGNYFIWLSKPPITTERQPMTIGGDGIAKRNIELLIP